MLDTNYWEVPLTAELSQYSANLAALGAYNIQIPPLSDDPSMAPGGNGYGSATLSAGGAVKLTLNLADGTSAKLSFASATAGDGTFPFFYSLYGGKGVLLGWLQFTNDGFIPANLEGTHFAWVKLPVAGKYYTNGFSTVGGPLITGSIFAPNKAVSNIVGATNLQAVFNDGGIEVNTILAYNPQKNIFTAQSPNSNSVTLAMTAASGALSGSFVPGHGAKPITFNGVFLPTSGAGCGFFPGTNQDTGRFTLNQFNASSNLSIEETYIDKLTGNLANGYSAATTATGYIQMTLPLNGEVAIATFDSNTTFSLSAGPPAAPAPACPGTMCWETTRLTKPGRPAPAFMAMMPMAATTRWR